MRIVKNGPLERTVRFNLHRILMNACAVKRGATNQRSQLARNTNIVRVVMVRTDLRGRPRSVYRLPMERTLDGALRSVLHLDLASDRLVLTTVVIVLQHVLVAASVYLGHTATEQQITNVSGAHTEHRLEEVQCPWHVVSPVPMVRIHVREAAEVLNAENQDGSAPQKRPVVLTGVHKELFRKLMAHPSALLVLPEGSRSHTEVVIVLHAKQGVVMFHLGRPSAQYLVDRVRDIALRHPLVTFTAVRRDHMAMQMENVPCVLRERLAVGEM